MRIIDLHCDTVSELKKGIRLADDSYCHITLDKLKKGDVMAQCFAIFIPTHRLGDGTDGRETPEEFFDGAYEAFIREMSANPDSIRQVFKTEDIERNASEGIISAILTVEDGVTLRGDISRLDEYYNKGVRMVALTWNSENSLGFPNSKDPAEHMRGLKPFGIEAVARMNELGIIVDTSHLSEGGFLDVARCSRKPFVASHSCARALCDHSRNLTDEQLRAIADAGGVVGLNYLTSFLRPVPEGTPKPEYHTTYDDVLRQLEYIRNVAGIDTLAMGSDYDGIESTMDWTDCGGNGLLLQKLERSFTPREIDKITHGNALRVFRDTIG